MHCAHLRKPLDEWPACGDYAHPVASRNQPLGEIEDTALDTTDLQSWQQL
jgi:hypothetical protein